MGDLHIVRAGDDARVKPLLERVRSFVAEYIVATETDLDTLALWALHTWVVNHYEVTPYLAVMSPVKRSGKTRLFEVLEKLTYHPMLTSNVSDAMLYRAIDELQPTLLYDEIDQLQMKDSQKGVLNSGYRKGSGVLRMVGKEPTTFSTYSPKGFASIGVSLPPTLLDRSIQIHLRRKLPSETVRAWREADARAEAEPIREALHGFADTFTRPTKPMTPPAFLNDREQELWTVLLELARLGGSEWHGRALAAAKALTDDAHREETDSAVLLLSDIREVFNETGARRIWAKDLLKELQNLENGTYNGPALDSVRSLSAAIANFRIRAKQIYMNKQNNNGYHVTDFSDAFTRYLPAPPK